MNTISKPTKKRLILITTKGTKTYHLVPDGHGLNIYRITSGFFTDTKDLIGHGSDLNNAVQGARMDAEAGDSRIKSSEMRDA